MTLEEINKLHLGSLVDYRGKTYLVEPRITEIDLKFFDWKQRNSLLGFSYPIGIRGFNVENPMEYVDLDVYGEDVKLSNKRIQKNTIDIILLKLKMFGMLDTYETEEPFEIGNYYFIKNQGVLFSKEISRILLDTEEVPLTDLYGNQISNDFFVIRQLKTVWEIYAADAPLHNIYVWKKTVVKKDTTDKVLRNLVDILSYRYYDCGNWNMQQIEKDDMKRVKLHLDIHLDRRMDSVDFVTLSRKLKHTLELVKRNKYENKEAYLDYLHLNYLYNHYMSDFGNYLIYHNSDLWRQEVWYEYAGEEVYFFELPSVNNETIREKLSPLLRVYDLLLTKQKSMDFTKYVIKSYSYITDRNLDLPYYYVDKKKKEIIVKKDYTVFADATTFDIKFKHLYDYKLKQLNKFLDMEYLNDIKGF